MLGALGSKMFVPWDILLICIPLWVSHNSHVCCVQAKKSQDVTSNAYITDADSIKAPRIALLRGRGPVCWDAAFYLEHSPDLPLGGIVSLDQAWDHYVTSGQFESRSSRYARTSS